MAKIILSVATGATAREVESVTGTGTFQFADKPDGCNYAEVFIYKDPADTGDYAIYFNPAGETPDSSDARLKDGDIVILENEEMISNLRLKAIDSARTTTVIAYYYHKTE